MTKEFLLNQLKKNPFVLAPMAGITDHAFRTFMKRLDASIVVTELVSAVGTQYKSEKTLKLMSFDNTQHPIGVQLFGETPEAIAEAAQYAESTGCDFIDLNFGCPVPKVVRKGAGSAMLKDLPQMRKVLAATVKAVTIPVTIKIRTGWDAGTRNADEVVKLAADEGITWVAIHGRTRAQSYSGFADWDYISEVKAKAQIPVLGNGDIVSSQQAVLRLNQSGCDGVLIGRGALKNPFIFRDALNLFNLSNTDRSALVDSNRNLLGPAQSPSSSHSNDDFSTIFKQLAADLTAHCEAYLLQIQLKKFAAWYSTGYPNAALFRKTIFQSKTAEEVLQATIEFFELAKMNEQDNQDNEGFLMGGHG